MKKNTIRAALALLVVTAGALSLAGCGLSAEEKSDGDSVYIREFDRPNGGTVECAFWIPTQGSTQGNQMECFVVLDEDGNVVK